MSRSGTRDALSGFLGESRAEVAPNVRRSRATLALTLILDLEVRSPPPSDDCPTNTGLSVNLIAIEGTQ